MFNLLNEIITHWIRYHTIAVLVDCLISPSYQLNNFYHITDPLSYPLGIPLFIIFTELRLILSHYHIQISFIEDTTHSQRTDVISIATVYKPSFTMYHGMSIVEGRDVRRSEMLRIKKQYRVRRKVTPLRKLNLDIEVDPVSKVQEKNEKDRLWTIEFPASRATRFLQKECCLDSVRKCYFITSLKEEKKLV